MTTIDPLADAEALYAAATADIPGTASDEEVDRLVHERTVAERTFMMQAAPALLAEVKLLRKELDLLRAELPRMCARVREQAAQELQDTVKGIVERAVRKGYDIGGAELDDIATALGIPTT